MGMIRDWALDKGSEIIGKKVYDYRTKGVGVGFILLALVGCLGHIFPDSDLPKLDWEAILTYFGLGLGAFGVGKKIEKGREENRVLSTKIIEQNQEILSQNTIEKVHKKTSPEPSTQHPTGGKPEQTIASPSKKWNGKIEGGFLP